MAKVSKLTASRVEDVGIGTVTEDVIAGYEFSFLDFHEAGDLSALLKGLPDDRCTCPHWGYVVRGQITFTFADHVETFEAGDAFYVEPGHSPSVAAGTEVLFISPEDEIAAVNAVIEANMAAMADA